MKLAEALCARADLQKKVIQLEERLKSIAKIQEGDEPVEASEDLLAELHHTTVQLESLIYRINLTNLKALRDGKSITQMIAKKDALTLEITTLRNVLKKAYETDFRYGRNEIKYITTVDTVKLRKYIDKLSAELRNIDMKIQESNWMFELETID